MRRFLSGIVAVVLATTGMLASGSVASADGQGTTVVSVRSDGTTVSLSRDTVPSGRVMFKVSTTGTDGSEIILFRPAANVTLAQVAADFQEVFSQDPATAAKGTRDLTRDVRFYGLAFVVPGTPATVTESLGAGTYYLMDLVGYTGSGGLPDLTTLRVRGSDAGRGSDSGAQGTTIRMTSQDRFVGPRVLPARGTVTVRNVSDTLHFMLALPVKDGTTDADVQAYFDSGSESEPPFARQGPSVGLGVLSPGRTAQLGYRLPAGTYVLLCFVADDETGMPHAVMGMYKVVVLK